MAHFLSHYDCPHSPTHHPAYSSSSWAGNCPNFMRGKPFQLPPFIQPTSSIHLTHLPASGPNFFFLSHKMLVILPFLSEAKPSSVLTSYHFLPFRKPYIINDPFFFYTINFSFLLFLYCHLNMRKSLPSFHIPCSFFSGSNSFSPPQLFLHLNKSGNVIYAYQQEHLFNEQIGSCNFSL